MVLRTPRRRTYEERKSCMPAVLFPRAWQGLSRYGATAVALPCANMWLPTRGAGEGKGPVRRKGLRGETGNSANSNKTPVRLDIHAISPATPLYSARSITIMTTPCRIPYPCCHPARPYPLPAGRHCCYIPAPCCRQMRGLAREDHCLPFCRASTYVALTLHLYFAW